MSVFSKGGKTALARPLTASLAVITAMSLSFTTPAAAAGSLYVERYQLQHKAEVKDYKVSFPHLFGIGDAKAQQSLNVLFEEKAKAARAAAEYRARITAAPTVSGGFEYNVTRNRDGVLSVLFTQRLCGDETHSAVTLNTVTGKRYLLSDLFVDNADYTGTICDIVRAYKGSRAERKTLISENAEYYLTDNSLVIIMSQAENGSKSREIAVPLSSLEGILKPCLYLT